MAEREATEYQGNATCEINLPTYHCGTNLEEKCKYVIFFLKKSALRLNAVQIPSFSSLDEIKRLSNQPNKKKVVKSRMLFTKLGSPCIWSRSIILH